MAGIIGDDGHVLSLAMGSVGNISQRGSLPFPAGRHGSCIHHDAYMEGVDRQCGTFCKEHSAGCSGILQGWTEARSESAGTTEDFFDIYNLNPGCKR